MIFTSIARGDVLFLDLNNSQKEVEAAQKAAAKRGERLIVKPTADQKLVAKMSAIERKIAQSYKQNSACYGPQRVEDRCKKILEQRDALDREYSSLAKQIPAFTAASLESELKTLAQDTKLTSVVISGHDGNGKFSGILGHLDEQAIKAAFSKTPSLKESVRSLLLWGCYTTNLGSLEFNWKDVFPNANMIAGYDGRAPLGDKPANWSYLEDVLIKEKELTGARDQKHLQKLFSSLKGVSLVDAAICVDKDTVVSRNAVTSLREAIASCKPDEPAQELETKFKCYERGLPGCEDLPKQTGSGPLREYYNYLQETKHCEQIMKQSGHVRPTPDQVIRLIFDRQVRENMETTYKEELEGFNQMLQKIGVPDHLQMKNLSSLTRADYVKLQTEITAEINKKRVQMKTGRLIPFYLKQHMPPIY